MAVWPRFRRAASGAFFPQSVNGFDEAGQIPLPTTGTSRSSASCPRASCSTSATSGRRPTTSCTATTRTPSRWGPPGCRKTRIRSTPIRSSTAPPASPANFYRPYQGYGNTTAYGFGANSNYHSLQISANRRFSQSFTFGVAYTWSKAMGTTNDDYTGNVPFNTHAADYDVLNTDRTHVAVLNWVYNTPKTVQVRQHGQQVRRSDRQRLAVVGYRQLHQRRPQLHRLQRQRLGQPERTLHRLARYRAAHRLHIRR